LYDEQILYFNFGTDSEKWRWLYDIETIAELQHTDNVVEMLLFEIRKLQPSTLETLKLASCIGSTFDVAKLSIISETDEPRIFLALSPAIYQGYIQPVYESGTTNEYRFLHDRVREGFYQLVTQSERPHLHYRIGTLLKSHSDGTLDNSQLIFQIALHLSLGNQLILEPNEQLESIQLYIKAATLSQLSGAHRQALDLAFSGLELLSKLEPDNYWNRYDEAIALKRITLENRYLCSQFEESEKDFQEILQHARTLLERVKVRRLLLALYTTLGDYENSLSQGISIMEDCGEKFEMTHTPFSDKLEDELLKNLPNRDPNYFLSLPLTNDPILHELQSTVVELMPVAYFVGNIELYYSIAVRAAKRR
jgi:predicted ATPase